MVSRSDGRSGYSSYAATNQNAETDDAVDGNYEMNEEEEDVAMDTANDSGDVHDGFNEDDTYENPGHLGTVANQFVWRRFDSSSDIRLSYFFVYGGSVCGRFGFHSGLRIQHIVAYPDPAFHFDIESYRYCTKVKQLTSLVFVLAAYFRTVFGRFVRSSEK
jgi:hypothetical protein